MSFDHKLFLKIGTRSWKIDLANGTVSQKFTSRISRLQERLHT